MFLTQIQKMTWQTECDMSNLYRAMTVQIAFSHRENNSDEVEFCINAWDAKELEELFKIFCQENNFADVSIDNISVVRVAATLEELTEMEEKEAGGLKSVDFLIKDAEEKTLKKYNSNKMQPEMISHDIYNCK